MSYYRGRKLGDGGMIGFLFIFLVMMSWGQAIDDWNEAQIRIYSSPDAEARLAEMSWLERNRPLLGSLIFTVVALLVVVPVVRLHPRQDPVFLQEEWMKTRRKPRT